MLRRIALLAIAAPRRVLAVAALLMVAAAVFGVPVVKSLSAGGFQDPTSESAQATKLLTDKFHQGDMQLLVTVTAPDGVKAPNVTAVATDIVNHLKQSPHVADVTSAWTVPQQAAADLISRDGKTGLIVAGITGGENNAPKYAETLSDEVVHDRDGVTVRSGGLATVYAQINAADRARPPVDGVHRDPAELPRSGVGVRRADRSGAADGRRRIRDRRLDDQCCDC